MGSWLPAGSCPLSVTMAVPHGPAPQAARTGQEERSPASGDKDVFMAELFCSFY